MLRYRDGIRGKREERGRMMRNDEVGSRELEVMGSSDRLKRWRRKLYAKP
jgi:hypothetical protein